jgi:hypothetical protein
MLGTTLIILLVLIALSVPIAAARGARPGHTPRALSRL